MFENGDGSFGDLREIWKAYFFVPEASEGKILEGGTLMQGSCSILPNKGILSLGELYSSTYHSKIFLLSFSFLFWGILCILTMGPLSPASAARDEYVLYPAPVYALSN